jgi:acyl-CoA reductase-like NAD-dependent aldehyde dehydrogenase
VGAVIVNDVPTYRVDTMPYGGERASGLGREGGREAVRSCTRARLLVVRRPRGGARG